MTHVRQIATIPFSLIDISQWIKTNTLYLNDTHIAGLPLLISLVFKEANNIIELAMKFFIFNRMHHKVSSLKLPVFSHSILYLSGNNMNNNI